MKTGSSSHEMNDNGNTDHTEWNLALPLDEQSPEVHGFLTKILTN